MNQCPRCLTSIHPAFREATVRALGGFLTISQNRQMESAWTHEAWATSTVSAKLEDMCGNCLVLLMASVDVVD